MDMSNFKNVANSIVAGSPVIVGAKITTDDVIAMGTVTPTICDIITIDGKDVSVFQFAEIDEPHHYFGGTLLTKIVKAWREMAKEAGQPDGWTQPEGIQFKLTTGTTKAGRQVTLVEVL